MGNACRCSTSKGKACYGKAYKVEECYGKACKGRSDRVMHVMVWNGRKMDVWAEMSGQCITAQGTRGQCI
jgi:hypothetical protein